VEKGKLLGGRPGIEAGQEDPLVLDSSGRAPMKPRELLAADLRGLTQISVNPRSSAA